MVQVEFDGAYEPGKHEVRELVAPQHEFGRLTYR